MEDCIVAEADGILETSGLGLDIPSKVRVRALLWETGTMSDLFFYRIAAESENTLIHDEDLRAAKKSGSITMNPEDLTVSFVIEPGSWIRSAKRIAFQLEDNKRYNEWVFYYLKPFISLQK